MAASDTRIFRKISWTVINNINFRTKIRKKIIKTLRKRQNICPNQFSIVFWVEIRKNFGQIVRPFKMRGQFWDIFMNFTLYFRIFLRIPEAAFKVVSEMVINTLAKKTYHITGLK